MNLGADESERPCEWLRELKESSAGYRELLRESGNRVIAAYRIAVARCRVSARSIAVPTVREVHAALCELHQSTSETTADVPSLRHLVADCEDAGLLVAGPFPRNWMT